MINAVIGKTMESVRNHWHIKLFTTERRKNYLVSEPSYHTAKFFTQNLLAIEMKKSKILMNKTVYWVKYYLKPKYGEKAKLCYMGIDIVHIKTDGFIEKLKEMLKQEHFYLWSR